MKQDSSIYLTAFLVLLIIIIGVVYMPDEPAEEQVIQKAKIFSLSVSYTPYDPTPLFEIKENRQKAEAVMTENTQIRETISTVMLPTVEMKLTSLGSYYITGYTSWELGGSTATASGATCHKADNYNDSFYNPTTCAIDPVLHDFGDLFYIPKFGCYIAEDTGSAVKQKHLDLYYGTTYEDNQEASKITGYYEVFSVEFIYGEVPATNYDIQGQVADLVIGWKLSDEMKGVTE